MTESPAPRLARFRYRVSVHRFVRVATRDDAVNAAACSVWLVTGPMSDPPAVIVEAAVHQVRAARYRHAGAGDGLWWVVTDAQVTMLAADSVAASEAVYQAVTVRRIGPQLDVFDHEMQVLPCNASAPRRAA
jgi:hypothetical protein